MSAPPRVFMDERIAARLPETPADAQEEIGQDVDVIAYIREDVHLAAVRSASTWEGQELIVTIQAIGPTLYGLSNQGRLWCHGSVMSEDDAKDRWHLVAEHELDS